MTETTLHDAQALVEVACKSMFGTDAYTRWLGVRVKTVMPGYARLSMVVRPEFLNGHHTCYDGSIFTLADSAFAFACNSHGHNTVAAGCSVESLHPVYDNGTLTAEATEQVLSGRHGIYDVRVTDQVGKVVAMSHSKSARIRGQAVPIPDGPELQFDAS